MTPDLRALPPDLVIKTGGSSGTVLFESPMMAVDYITSGVRENSPFSFVLNGILFTDGLNAEMASPGMKSITVTYIGGD